MVRGRVLIGYCTLLVGFVLILGLGFGFQPPSMSNRISAANEHTPSLSVPVSINNVSVNNVSASGTFGLDGGDAVYTEVPGHLQAQRFQNTICTGNLTKLEIKFNQPACSGTIRMGIYSDNEGRPGHCLLAAGEVPAGPGWVSIENLNYPVKLGSYYWLVFNLQDNNTLEYQTGGESGSHVWGEADAGALPGDFPEIKYSGDSQYVMRATVSSFPPAPVKEWDRTFGGYADDRGFSVVQTSDGGYAIGGLTNSFGKTPAWLVKTDINGNKIWDKTYGADGNTCSVIQTSDGGLAISSSHWGAHNGISLIKTDGLGNKLWEKVSFSVTPIQDRYAYSIIQSKDLGYVIVGRAVDVQGSSDYVLMIKTDVNGDKQWDKTFDVNIGDRGLSVIQTPNGGYFILGSSDKGGADGLTYVLKTDANGNLLWNKVYGISDHEASIIRTLDGNYVISTVCHTVEGNSLHLVKINADGNIIWETTPLFFGIHAGTINCSGGSVVQANDGGYIVASSVGKDILLVRTDSQGRLLGYDIFGGPGDDSSSAIIRAADGGYVLAGSTSSSGVGNSDVWLIKFAGENASPTPAPTPTPSSSPTPTLTPTSSPTPTQTRAPVPVSGGGNGGNAPPVVSVVDSSTSPIDITMDLPVVSSPAPSITVKALSPTSSNISTSSAPISSSIVIASAPVQTRIPLPSSSPPVSVTPEPDSNPNAAITWIMSALGLIGISMGLVYYIRRVR